MTLDRSFPCRHAGGRRSFFCGSIFVLNVDYSRQHPAPGVISPLVGSIAQILGELIGSAVVELLRFDSAVQNLGRVATADIEIAGKTIKARELVFLCFGSADRDPEQFSNSD